MEENVSFWHFNFCADKKMRPSRNGRGTVAYVVQGDKVHLAVSFCSPRDIFTRKQGRDLAAFRLASNECTYARLPADGMSPEAIRRFVGYVLTNGKKLGVECNWRDPVRNMTYLDVF